MWKSLVFVSLILWGCGGSSGSSDKSEAEGEGEPAADPLFDKECLANNTSPQLAKPVVTFCKTLADGTVATVSIQPGDDVVDPLTCKIGYDGRGLIEALIELQFETC